MKYEYEKLKTYNCSNNYISLTSDVFPSNNAVVSQLNLPLGISICPLNNSNQDNIPIIDYGSKTIPRCPSNECRAYLNPFVKFIENGEKWVCNFCGAINDTEDHYFCDVDKNGIRLDINEKTELCCGSYEFLTNKTYWKKGKTPTEAMFIFLIETSLGAIDSGFLSACVESVKDVINNESFYNGNKIKINIITYNQGVDFYSFNEKFTQPQMLTVNDEPVFLPTYKSNLIFDLSKDKDKIIQILELIQNNFNRNNQNMISNNCKDSTKIFSALNGAYLLGKGAGGKIIIFSSSNSLSTNPKMNGGIDKTATKEQIAYSSHDKKQLGNMGINLTNENMSVDIFASAENQIKTYTLNQLCDFTNGNLYFYKKFNIELHYKNIFNQIRRVLTRPICWEGVNRTRFSHGLYINNFVTPVLITNMDLFIFPTGDSDQNYCFTVGYKNSTKDNEKDKNNNLNDNNNEHFAYIQSALLYSYGDGNRRIRIHNLCVPLTKSVNNIYEAINSEMLASFYVKETIDKIYKTKALANAIISTDTKFKQLIDKIISGMHKIKKELPSNLNYLPLYMIGMFKHRLFCKDELDKKYDLDIANFLRTKLQKMSIQEIISFICPTIYAAYELETNPNLGKYDDDSFNMPNIVSCSINAMQDGGLYIIDNGYLIIMYIKKNVTSNILQNLFGVDDLNFLTMATNEENVFSESNDFKERLMNIIDYIRGGKSLYQNMIFVFEGTNGERIINESLIEDNKCTWFPMDYTHFYQKYIQQSGGIYGY